jgi:hypothetical protein
VRPASSTIADGTCAREPTTGTAPAPVWLIRKQWQAESHPEQAGGPNMNPPSFM